MMVATAVVAAGSGCSLKKRAVNALAEVFDDAETVYLADDDPELVGEALPFNLKTLETLLLTSPRHRGMLLAAAKSFTLYAYGFVEPEADRVEDVDFDRAEAIRRRAARLYLRGYRYGLRALELDHPGLGGRLSAEPDAAAAALDHEDVPAAVWTAAALGGAIGVAKDEPELTADIAVVGALLRRALEIEPEFEDGLVHQLYFVYETQRVGGSLDEARRHYERALELGPGARCSTWLAWAENVSVARQDRDEFVALLDRVLAFDVDAHPENRLLNLLAQRRARWLKARVDELFLEGDTD